MYIGRALRFSGIVGLTLSMVVGCGTQPPVEEVSAAPATPVAAGPSPAVTQALEVARAALDRAASVGGEWRDSAATLKKAQEAAQAGNEAKALQLAAAAREQGELGFNQAYYEKAKPLIKTLQGHESRMSAAQLKALRSAQDAMAAYQGKRAYDAASALLAAM